MFKSACRIANGRLLLSALVLSIADGTRTDVEDVAHELASRITE